MLKSLKPILTVYLLIFLAGTVAFFVLINIFDPSLAVWYVFGAVYFSVFLAAFGLGSTLVTGTRYFLGSKSSAIFSKITIIRQGVFLGLLVAMGFFLQSQRVLSAVTALLLVLTLVILELYFLNKN